MKTVIIRGYYGRDNLGDEIMKDIFINCLGNQHIKLYIMNSSPQDLEKRYGLKTPEELITGKLPSIVNFFKRIKRIIGSDLYVYGGGTILTDKHSCMHLMENNLYFIARKLIRKNNLLISVGATHFKSIKGKILCKMIILFSTFTYVRDNDSYNLLRDMMNRNKRLVKSADMVLLVKDYIKNIKPYENSRVIGLCIMPYYKATFHSEMGDEEILEQLEEQLLKINEKHSDMTFCIIPIQYGKNDRTDYDFSLKLLDRLKKKLHIFIFEGQTVQEKINQISKCEYLISMRLHALMLGKLMEKKVLAIDHNEKIHYFMKRYDSIQNVVPFEKINILSIKFELLIKNELCINRQNLLLDYEKAKGNIKIIKDMIGE